MYLLKNKQAKRLLVYSTCKNAITGTFDNQTTRNHLNNRLVFYGIPTEHHFDKKFFYKIKRWQIWAIFWIKLNADKSDRIMLVKMSQLKIWLFDFLHTCVRESQWYIGRKYFFCFLFRVCLFWAFVVTSNQNHWIIPI